MKKAMAIDSHGIFFGHHTWQAYSLLKQHGIFNFKSYGSMTGKKKFQIFVTVHITLNKIMMYWKSSYSFTTRTKTTK